MYQFMSVTQSMSRRPDLRGKAKSSARHSYQRYNNTLGMEMLYARVTLTEYFVRVLHLGWAVERSWAHLKWCRALGH